MMTPKRRYLILVPIAIVLWVFVGPQPLGGRAAYVTTRGISMEPKYSQGDLVVVQKAASYGTGDVIAYKSRTLRTIVLHRIVEREPAGFITKGDNNDWLDPDRIRSADVIGRAWFHVPGAGKLLATLRNPIAAVVLAAAVGISFFIGGKQMTRRRRERKRGQRRSENGLNLPRIGIESFTQTQKRSLLAIAAVAALSVIVLASTLLRPPIKNVSSASAYVHKGSFTYAAEVEPNTVYPDGSVSTGDPIFTRAVRQVTIGFDYELDTRADASVNGFLSLAARVVGQSGWTKPLLIAKPVPFGGKTAHAEGILDLTEVNQIARRVQRVTGIAESAHSIEVTPTVNVRGRLAGQDIAEDFNPRLALTLEAFQLKIGADSEGGTALSAAQPGRIKASQLAANNFSFFGLNIGHSIARNGSLMAFVLVLIAGGALWRRFSNPAHADEPALIAAQYADWLVPVETMRRDPQRSVHIRGFDALMRLAELYERMILHESRDGNHTYSIEEEGVLYYYETSDTKKAALIPRTPIGGPAAPPPPPPPRSPLPRRLKEQDPDRLQRLREELRQIEDHIDDPGPAKPDR